MLHEATDMRSRLIGFFAFVAAIVAFCLVFTALGFGSGGRVSIAKWVTDSAPAPASLIKSSNYYVSQYIAKPAPSLMTAVYKPWVDRYTSPSVGVNAQTRTVVTSAAQYANELRCMTEAIYYEARGEKVTGRFAVAEVVLNRMNDARYPNTVCGVVYQGAMDGSKAGCQFSFTCDGSLKAPIDMKSWRYSRELAKLVMYGMGTHLTEDATHYHADYVRPYWAPTLKRTVRIGRHIFYRWNSDEDKAPRLSPAAAPLSTTSSSLTSGVPGSAG